MKYAQAVEVMNAIILRFLGPADQSDSVKDAGLDSAHEALKTLRGFLPSASAELPIPALSRRKDPDYFDQYTYKDGGTDPMLWEHLFTREQMLEWGVTEAQRVMEKTNSKPVNDLDPRDLYIGTVAVFARSGGWVSNRQDGVYAEQDTTGAVAVAVGSSPHGNRAMAVDALRVLNQQGVQGLLAPRFYDHEVARTVNKVTEVAREFAGHQSLRERIAQVLREELK